MESAVRLREAPDAGVRSPVYALVGNPNCGKTTLFNALTGLRQKVGNYPGVTVEKKEGTCFSQHGKPIPLIDLPGAYSLSARSIDEAIVQEVLLGLRPDTARPDRIICIIDASNLERNLFFATQVVELGMPMILVLNMMDVAEKRGFRIDAAKLERLLGVTVVSCQAHKGEGLIELRLAMSRKDLSVPTWRCSVPEMFSTARREVQERLGEVRGQAAPQACAVAGLLLGDGMTHAAPGASPINPEALQMASEWQLKLDRESPGWNSELVVARYARIGEMCREVVRRTDPGRPSMTERIDAVMLHPVWGWMILGGVMGSLFFSIFSLAEYPMNWIERGTAIAGDWIGSIMPPGELHNLIVDGVLAGVGGVVIFLPQIMFLFFFIGLLEATGYMARAAFILDRLMGRVGLQGKSFIPLLSSFACAVPGIMATRTIESPKDRLATIMVAPFMTCSARLPVYLLMIAALVPVGEAGAFQKAGLLLLLYSLGTGAAFCFAWLFKSTLLKGESHGHLMELPPYRMPSLKSVMMEMLQRVKIFLRRAGTIILGISILLWFMMSYPKVEEGSATDQLSYSMAGRIGQAIEPIMKPLGFDWKIDIGVLASFAAREVFVSTMAIIYNVEGADPDNTGRLVSVLRSQKREDGRPVFTPLTCISLMVFYVFALQCMSTVAVVKRETNSWRWPIFQLAYMTALAYTASLIVYQTGRFLGFD